MPRIVTDIDGTILSDEGKPVQSVIEYIKANSEEVVVLTARWESRREQTVADLEQTGLAYERLVMMPDDHEGTAAEFKAEQVKALIEEGLEVDEFIDDNADNRAAVAAIGVRVTDPDDLAGEDDSDDSEPDSDGSAFSASLKDKNMEPNLSLTPEQLVASLTERAAALSAESETKAAALAALEQSAAAKEADLSAQLANALAAVQSLKDELTAANAKVLALEEAKVNASDEAAKIAAKMGVAPLAATPAGEPESIKPESILAKYEALSGDERQAFFRANKRAIFAARMKAE
jgi:hypothetical protein